MGILKKIESLREQPKSVRNQYAFWIALSVSLIITLVWVATIPSRFLPAEVATSSQHDGISNFAQNIKDISYQLGESISAIRTKAEYAQTEFVATSSVNTLNLDALFDPSTSTQATGTKPTTTSLENGAIPNKQQENPQ